MNFVLQDPFFVRSTSFLKDGYFVFWNDRIVWRDSGLLFWRFASRRYQLLGFAFPGKCSYLWRPHCYFFREFFVQWTFCDLQTNVGFVIIRNCATSFRRLYFGERNRKWFLFARLIRDRGKALGGKLVFFETTLNELCSATKNTPIECVFLPLSCLYFAWQSHSSTEIIAVS